MISRYCCSALLLYSSTLAAEAVREEKAHYTFPERLLRLCYFRMAVSEEDYLEKMINLFCSSLNIASWETENFLPSVTEKTLEAYRTMGAEEYYVSTADGKGIVHMLIFQSKKLEEKIISFGARWERVKNGGKTLFAILPPPTSSAKWENFEKSCLAILGWKKQGLLLQGKKTDAWTTCENADLISDEKVNTLCFFHCHSNSHSFASERERTGCILGMKQDLCFFDHRGVGYSRGIPSERGFYLDLEAVYNQLMAVAPYAPEDLWVGGFCAGGPVAGYMKRKLHEKGVNFYSEQSFSDLKRDFIDTQNWVIRWLGDRAMGGLKSPDLSLQFAGKPAEFHFSIEKMWKDLPYLTDGKVVILHTLNDQFLPAKVRLKFVEVAQSVNRNVIPIFYFSTNPRDVHSDSFYFYPDVQRRFMKAIFE